MKHIAGMGYIKETGADEYAPTNFSRALTIPIIGDGYPALYVFSVANLWSFNCSANWISAGGAHMSCSRFAEYMQKTKYATPSDAKAGPYQYAFDTEMNMFEYLHAHPPLGKQFDHHMSGYRQGRPSWMDPNFYPVEEQLIKGMRTSHDAVMLVDIGGGLGHDLEEFRYVVIQA